MKKLRKVSSVILGVIISCMCLVTPVSAAENSEATAVGGNTPNSIVTTNTPTHCKHCTMEFLEHNHYTLNPVKYNNINATTTCKHTGGKSTRYVGTCFCGGMLYRVDCEDCGAFLRGICLNFCGYWD